MYRVSLIIVSLHTECFIVVSLNMECPYCVHEHGLCLIIVSLIRIVSYYCVPAHGVSLVVSLNTDCVLLLCPCTRSFSCCVPEHGLSLIIVSLHTEFLLCPWTRIVSYYCVPYKDCLLLLCPWTRSVSYYFVPEDGKLTYTYPASSGTYHDSNCLAQQHGKRGHFSSVSVCNRKDKDIL